MGRVSEIADMLREEIEEDVNSPYTVHFKDGKAGRHGQSQIRTKRIKAISQPAGDKERIRLEGGDKYKQARFWAMVDEYRVNVGDKIDYKGSLYEIKNIQDWEEMMKAVGVKID